MPFTWYHTLYIRTYVSIRRQACINEPAMLNCCCRARVQSTLYQGINFAAWSTATGTKKQGFSRVMTRLAGRRVKDFLKLHASGRVGSGQDFFKLSRVGSGRVGFDGSGPTGRVR